jgi:phosphoribosyl 1,2-cyclic phosphodiesterase
MRQSIDDIFRVHVLGVGNYHSEFHSTVSFVVQAGSRLILVEAPGELRRKLQEYRELVGMAHDDQREAPLLDTLKAENINDLVVTHVHGDHAAGLELIAWYKMFKQEPRILEDDGRPSGRNVWPRLYGTNDVLCDLERSLEPSLANGTGLCFNDFFSPVVVEPGTPANIGEIVLEVMPNHHGVAGFALRLGYRGKRLSYSGDTRFDAELAHFLSEAEVMIHDCDGSNAVHTSPDQLKEWLESSGYDGRLYVCHLDDSVKPEDHGLTPLPENDFIDV